MGNVDRCDYCQSARTLSARNAGLATERTVAVRKVRVVFAPKLVALLSLIPSAANLGHLPDDVWQTALDAGWSERELTEASERIGLSLFTNHFNHLGQTDLDVPAAPGL